MKDWYPRVMECRWCGAYWVEWVCRLWGCVVCGHDTRDVLVSQHWHPVLKGLDDIHTMVVFDDIGPLDSSGDGTLLAPVGSSSVHVRAHSASDDFSQGILR